MTNGILKVICARRIVVNPALICRNLNRSIREIPVTISAFIMGILVIPIITDLVLEDRPIMAIQVKVPIMVEKNVARTAIDNVLKSALATASSDKRLMYQSSVKPPHLARDLLELKESTIRVKIGAYMKIRIIAR